MVKENGFLTVDQNHKVYYERIGQTNAPTLLFLHGGPGLGFSEKDRSFFDFNKCNVIFHDQRGAGRSQSKDIIENNTTQALINDINLIYEQFNIKEVILFGGSWGSTLALVFAIKYPERVRSMILRGLFRGSRSDRHYYESGPIKKRFPKEWARIKAHSGEAKDEGVMYSLYKDILEKEDQQSYRKAFELVLFGASINNQGFDESLIKEVEAINYFKKAKILSHYAINELFLKENYIEQNKYALKNIPIHVIHGKKDFICPVDITYDFSKEMENCELHITEEGHSPYTPNNKQELIDAVTKQIGLQWDQTNDTIKK